jgi:hypothetical protein
VERGGRVRRVMSSQVLWPLYTLCTSPLSIFWVVTMAISGSDPVLSIVDEQFAPIITGDLSASVNGGLLGLMQACRSAGFLRNDGPLVCSSCNMDILGHGIFLFVLSVVRAEHAGAG